jgi:CheY-like chemotaxis protein
MDGVVQKERIWRELPCAPHYPPAVRRAPAASAPAAALRILLLEDHLDTAAAMAYLLRHLGYHVRHAPDVSTALRVVAQEPFDLIISDIALPDGTGLDFIRQLPDVVGGRRVRAIALSGRGMEHDIESSRSAGFAEHLVKPVEIDQLDAAIRRVTSAPEA